MVVVWYAHGKCEAKIIILTKAQFIYTCPENSDSCFLIRYSRKNLLQIKCSHSGKKKPIRWNDCGF